MKKRKNLTLIIAALALLWVLLASLARYAVGWIREALWTPVLS